VLRTWDGHPVSKTDRNLDPIAQHPCGAPKHYDRIYFYAAHVPTHSFAFVLKLSAIKMLNQQAITGEGQRGLL